MKIITAILICFVLFAIAIVQSQEHQQRKKRTSMAYESVGVACNPETMESTKLLNIEYDDLWERYRRLAIFSCPSVNLNLSRNPHSSTRLIGIQVQNITNTLNFRPAFLSQELDSIELSDIGYVPEFLTEYTFSASLRTMDLLKIQNTKIGRFNQSFLGAKLNNVILRNVTVKNLEGLDTLSDNKGESLEIVDCRIVVTASPVNLGKFHDVRIINSTFEFNHVGGNMTISGDRITLENINIMNAAVNVTGSQTVNVRNTCGAGSRMLIHSSNTESHGNELSGGIVYSPFADANQINQSNNVICINGECHCLSSISADRFQSETV